MDNNKYEDEEFSDELRDDLENQGLNENNGTADDYDMGYDTTNKQYLNDTITVDLRMNFIKKVYHLQK